jgi:AmmeMemoRadiSam system protein A
LSDNASSLNPEQRRFLLDLARDSIRFGVRNGKPIPVELSGLPAELTVQRATFVTLESNGVLRGCIGCLVAIRPLAADIAENAYAAAFRDPRFPPVTAAEVEELDIHLSLLTPAQPMTFLSEADLIGQLQPDVDGLILEDGPRRGTFLPSVWESLPDPSDFLRHLKRKAGLPADYWSDTLKISRYRTETVHG